MFYSSNFIYDGKYSDEFDFHLVTEGGDILNEYGINFSDNKEITLTFCYSSANEEAQVWNDEVIEFAHSWFISDEYKPFISEDNDKYCYLLKGISLVKRFSIDMTGLIDVTFEVLDNYTYRQQNISIGNTEKEYSIYNYSNVNKPYKPIVELYNIQSTNISISNNTLSKSLVLNNLTIGDNVTIDNEIGTIYNQDGVNLIMKSNRNWIEFKKGTNKIKINGECSAKFKSMYPIMR